MTTPSLSLLSAFAPELVLGLGTVAAVVVHLLARNRPELVARFGILVCGAAAILALDPARGALDGNLLVVDGVQIAARWAILVATALVLAAAAPSRAVAASRVAGEHHIAVLALGAGALVLSGSSNLLTLILGVEATSLTAYLLAGWRRRDRDAAEAGMKYVMFGAIATGLMAFGASHLYGLTGTLDAAALAPAISQAGPAITIALILIAAGLAYKLSLVPFHLYAPDVYQGAPATSIAAFGTLPKIAALAVLVRLLTYAAPIGPAAAWAGTALAVVGIATVLVGALIALVQHDARRILAFSSIVHAGTMILALVAWPAHGGVGPLAFYAASYTVLAIGSFVALGAIETDAKGLDRLRGGWRRAPVATVALVVLLCGLAGIPPLAGFFAKWLVLRECIGLATSGSPAGLFAAAAVLAGTALTIVAYLRVLRAVMIEDPLATPAPAGDSGSGIALLCAGTAIILPLALPWWGMALTP